VCQLAHANKRQLRTINVYKLPLLLLYLDYYITRPINESCDCHNLISLQYADYTDHLLFIGHLFMTPMPFEQNKLADPQ